MTTFFALCAVSGRYGRHPAHQDVLRLAAHWQSAVCYTDEHYKGLLLRATHLPYRKPHSSLRQSM